MCLCEDWRKAGEAEGRRSARVARGAQALPNPRPAPCRPHRSRNPLRVRGQGTAWKERESKSKASCTLKFSKLRLLRRQASSCSSR